MENHPTQAPWNRADVPDNALAIAGVVLDRDQMLVDQLPDGTCNVFGQEINNPDRYYMVQVLDADDPDDGKNARVVTPELIMNGDTDNSDWCNVLHTTNVVREDARFDDPAANRVNDALHESAHELAEPPRPKSDGSED